MDEKCILTGGGKHPKIVSTQKRPQVVTPERSQNVTVFGAGNAAGTQIPPYFVFPGKRMLPKLLEGATTGSDGTVSDTGYSNGTIFTNYLQNHFLKYVQGRDPSSPIIVLFMFRCILMNWHRKITLYSLFCPLIQVTFCSQWMLDALAHLKQYSKRCINLPELVELLPSTMYVIWHVKCMNMH